jgi:hypothetical protein
MRSLVDIIHISASASNQLLRSSGYFEYNEFIKSGNRLKFLKSVAYNNGTPEEAQRHQDSC